jgi:thioredoxin-like negative regulator of GroEL
MRLTFVHVLVMTTPLATHAHGQDGSLRVPRLDNSGAAHAQEAFHEGMEALHNFQYLEAAESFREAQRLDPEFTLAYWGEALTHSHVLWGQHDVEAARAVLGRLGPTPAARQAAARLPHERALLQAAEALFGQDSLRAGLRAFSGRIEPLHRNRPHDHDVAALYGLSIIALAPLGAGGMPARAPGVEVLERVFAANPHHAGVAHYLIHAYDDVQHAPLGLPAAEVYADLAPASPHAQHMPSHIFLPLGRWAESARVNQVAYDASVRLQVARGWPLERRDWHALLWLSYSLAQQGRYARLEEVVRHFGEMAAATSNSSAVANHVAARAILTLESGVWSHAPTIAEARVGAPVSQANVLIATAMHARQRRDTIGLDSIRGVLAGLLATAAEGTAARTQIEVASLMIDAIHQAGRDSLEGVLVFAERAAALEHRLALLPGIQLPLKPAAELYGEALLGAQRAADARAQFHTVLQRRPRRPSSLWGLARAQLALGDTADAKQTLDELSTVWADADPGSIRVHRLHEVRAVAPTDAVLPFIAPQVAARLREIGGGRLRWIVNTHYHSDHVGGNAALGSVPSCRRAAAFRSASRSFLAAAKCGCYSTRAMPSRCSTRARACTLRRSRRRPHRSDSPSSRTASGCS